MIVWSGSWVSGKLIANTADAPITLFWRYLFFAAALAPVLIWRGENFRINFSQALWALLGGAIMSLYTYLFFIGLKTGYAGAAGVLVTAMNPIFTFLLTCILFKQSLTWRDGVGLLLGLMGGAILLELWLLRGDKVLLAGNLLFLFAALVYAFVTLTTNAASKRLSILVYSFYLNAFGAILVLIILGRDIVNTPALTNHEYWMNIIYLGVISNAFATTVYFFAVNSLGSARASAYIFIVPSTALLLAALYLREPVKWPTLGGGVIALAAVALLRGRASTELNPSSQQ